MLTITDLFCGAGGSSTGAIQVPGVTVRVASNHWDLAVETHNANHQQAAHICADLSQIDPRYFPNTDILWASPSCTNHSVAQGRKREGSQPDLFEEVLPDDAAERSRATMWDVVRFSEHHHYRAVIVENVVDVYRWLPFQSWLMAMESVGYEHQIVYLNSMHAQVYGPGAAQSRDRIYIVFWKRGDRRPDLARITRPDALCVTCGPVSAMQVFKKQDSAPWGRYRAQYVYRCPNVTCRNSIVEPVVRGAHEIIDWTLEGQRIGDRAKPLATKTMARIQAGIDKYWSPFIPVLRGQSKSHDARSPLSTVSAGGIHHALAVPVEGRSGKTAAPIEDPLRTMTTRNETGLLVPCGGTWRTDAAPTAEPISTRTTRETDGLAFIAELRGGGSDHRPTTDPLATVTASGNHHGLVTSYYGKGTTGSADEPLPTVTTVERHGLLMRNNSSRSGPGAEMVTPVAEPARTITTAGHQSLLAATRPTIRIDDVQFRMLEPTEIAAAMDFPTTYRILGNRREQVRLSGNAVTPCAARDLVGIVAEALMGTA